jgi:hypothetical protein
MAAKVVMMMGRKRSMHAWKISRSGERPPRRSRSSAKSAIMIPFFLTMPINRMMPINAINDSSVLKTCKASSAPRPADGNVEMKAGQRLPVKSQAVRAVSPKGRLRL